MNFESISLIMNNEQMRWQKVEKKKNKITKYIYKYNLHISNLPMAWNIKLFKLYSILTSKFLLWQFIYDNRSIAWEFWNSVEQWIQLSIHIAERNRIQTRFERDKCFDFSETNESKKTKKNIYLLNRFFGTSTQNFIAKSHLKFRCVPIGSDAQFLNRTIHKNSCLKCKVSFWWATKSKMFPKEIWKDAFEKELSWLKGRTKKQTKITKTKNWHVHRLSKKKKNKKKIVCWIS